jgi:hypothetical protein
MADDVNTPHVTSKDLQTPTVKSAVYTTGRGGCGNMAYNDDPRQTRLRQDVEPVMRRSSSGAQHSGRGGAGNIFNPDEVNAHRKGSTEHAIADDDHSSRRSFEHLAHKGKELLFGKKH